MSDYISEDSLLQIFRSLPVKTLVRFQCVSKCWKEIIQSPSFVKEHLAVQTPRLIFEYEDEEPEAEREFLTLDLSKLPFLFDSVRSPNAVDAKPQRNCLIGTLHEVVCLYYNDIDLLLWNPAIRKFSRIRLPEIMYPEWWGDRDDRIVTTYSGFWIDPTNNEFKIVMFRFIDEEDTVFGVLYSSIQSRWSTINLVQDLKNCKSDHPCPPVIIGGVAYWQVVYWFQNEDEDIDLAILSFDFRQERFKVIHVPESILDDFVSFSLVPCHSQGTISILCWDEDFPSICNIYMRGEQDSWPKMFCFNLTPTITRIFSVFGETKENARIIAIHGSELVLYDTRGGRISLRSGLENSHLIMAHDYVESLIFP